MQSAGCRFLCGHGLIVELPLHSVTKIFLQFNLTIYVMQFKTVKKNVWTLKLLTARSIIIKKNLGSYDTEPQDLWAQFIKVFWTKKN